MNVPRRIAVALVGFCLFVGVGGVRAQEAGHQETSFAPDNATQPLVVYYSRTGKARLAATVLAHRLGCETAEIVSKRSIGIFTITFDQLFNRTDEQEAFVKDLRNYNPIVLVSPIWFMKLSSPVRTFIQRHEDLKGRDVYIITTSGGPMEKKNEDIAAAIREHGLTVRGVFNIGRIMKKTEQEIGADIDAFLARYPLRTAAGAAQ